MTGSSPAQSRSLVSNDDTLRVRQAFQIPASIIIRAPAEEDRITSPPEEYLSVYLFMLEYGLRFPLSPFVNDLLLALQIPAARLCPRAWRIIMAAERGWGQSNYPPLTIAEFFHCYRPDEGTGSLRGWAQLTQRPTRPKLVREGKPTEKRWKEKFLFFSITPELTLQPSAYIRWREPLFLSHRVFAAANSFQRKRIAEIGTQPFGFTAPAQRFRLACSRRRAARHRHADCLSEPDRFWSEVELEFPSECVLLWLFNRSINPDPMATAIEYGLIGKDENGRVTILRPHWKGLFERWERLERDGRSYDDWSDEEDVAAPPPEISTVETLPVVLPATPETPPLRRQCKLELREGSKPLSTHVRQIPAPITRHPPMLGPIQYGAALLDFTDKANLSSDEYLDRFYQVTGEVAHTVNVAATQWENDSSSAPEVAPFVVRSVPSGASEELRQQVAQYEQLQRSIQELADSTRCDHDANTLLRRTLQSHSRTLQDLEGRITASERRSEELGLERDKLLSVYQTAFSCSSPSPSNLTARLITNARKRLACVLGKLAAQVHSIVSLSQLLPRCSQLPVGGDSCNVINVSIFKSFFIYKLTTSII